MRSRRRRRRRRRKKQVRMMRQRKKTKGRMSLNMTILSLFLKDIPGIRRRKPVALLFCDLMGTVEGSHRVGRRRYPSHMLDCRNECCFLFMDVSGGGRPC
jgi:hypothetical protein